MKQNQNNSSTITDELTLQIENMLNGLGDLENTSQS